MINYKKILVILFILLMPYTQIYSAFDDIAKGGARTLGMGGAFVAVENSGEGVLINPAAIMGIDNGSFTAMYSPLYIGLDDGSFDNGFFNVVYHYDGIGIFSLNWEFLKTSTKLVSNLYNEDTIVLTYSRQVNEEITAGLKINYYKWCSAKQTDLFGNTESLSSSALSFGLGAYYNVKEDFKIGLCLNNVNMPRIDDDSKGIDDTERMPFQVQPGICFFVKKIMIALDVKFLYENVDMMLGSEYWFLNKEQEKIFGCRIGMNFPDLGNGFNVTAGLSVFIWRDLSFDYGFLIPITTITSIWGEHKFSISYKF